MTETFERANDFQMRGNIQEDHNIVRGSEKKESTRLVGIFFILTISLIYRPYHYLHYLLQ